MKILALGDVVGRRTLSYLSKNLWQKRAALGADFVIANGENVADIKGLTVADAEELLAAGVDLITTGNHVFDKREIYDHLDTSRHILRPVNYPGSAPGEGARVVTVAEGWRMLLDRDDPVADVVRLHRMAIDGGDFRADAAWKTIEEMNTTTGHYFRGAE